jgi:penicillin-binding protein 1A
MTIFYWKGERYHHDPFDSICYKVFLQSVNGNGTTNREYQSLGWWNNYKYFQYDHVGQGARQVGSTFKPFVYATAEQLNMSQDLIIDAPFFYHASRDHATEATTKFDNK